MKLTLLRLLGGTLLFAGISQLAPEGLHGVAFASSPRSHVAAPALSSPYATGLALYKAGKLKQAETQFRLAIKKHDHLAQAYNGLGNAALYLHDYPTAYKAFKQVAVMAPKDPLVEYNTATAALYAAYYHDAVRYATSFIKLRPKDWRGYHLRFLAYGNLLEPKQQLHDAAIVVQLDSKDPAAWNDLGIAMSQVKQYRSAINAFDHAIKLSPGNGSFYMNRGVTENLAKQFGAALADLKKARSLITDPTVQKKLDSAIKYLEQSGHK